MFWNKIEQLNQVRPMVKECYRCATDCYKKRFLRHNRCIELRKRYIKALVSARVKQLSPDITVTKEGMEKLLFR